MKHRFHIDKPTKLLFIKRSIVLLFLLLGSVTYAQISIKLDTTKIRIGEQIQCELAVEKEANLDFPKLALDSLNKIEILYRSPIDSLTDKLKRNYILTSFDAGTYHIPPQVIQVNNKQYLSDSLLIEVQTVAIDTTKQKLFPIKSIYKADPKTWHEFVHYLWWLLGVLSILGLLWWWFFKRKGIEKRNKKQLLTPIETALLHFDSLDKKDLVIQNKIKAYYIELTDIVRQYIGEDVQIPTLEVTTDELITLLEIHNKSKKLDFSKERITELHHFLQQADLVKFAKSKPDIFQIEEDRKTAETIIQDIQAAVHKPVLDEFGNEILQETPEEIAKKEQKVRRKKSLLIGGGILLFSIIAITWYYGLRYVKDTLIGHPTKELLEGNWYSSSYGYPTIGLETPKILKSIEMSLPEEAKKVIVSNGTFVYGSFIDGFYITASAIEFDPKIELEIDNGVNDAIQMIEQNPSISDFEYEVEDTEIYGVLGKKITGTLIESGHKMEYIHFIFLNGQATQQVAIANKIDDVYAKEIRKRIIKSIQLENLEADEDTDE